MAKYDYGGGCPCGLYSECTPDCVHAPRKLAFAPHEENHMHDDVNDFGFTLVGEEDIRAQTSDKAYKLRDMIMPLLLNLKGSPDKDYIQWPAANRIAQIDGFIKKMNDLVDG